MVWDQRQRERYEKEVLAKARASKQLPSDLFVRYGIDDGLRSTLRADPAAFDRHVAEVCRYWRGLQRRKALKKLAVDLVAAHEKLEREHALTFQHFEKVSRAEVERGRREWEEIARNLTTTHIDRSTLASLIEPVGLPAAEAEKTLRRQGVRVVDRLPELPSAAPTTTFRTLRENLRTRGVEFSPMVVFGERRVRAGFTVLNGFRLKDGSRIDGAALASAAQKVEVEALTDAKTAAENIITILKAAGDSARRDAIVLWEIVADMRAKPATIAEPGLAQPWIRRGLAKEEAALIAATVRQSTAVDPAGRAEEEVRGLLAENRLRAAQSAVTALPENHDLHVQVSRRASEVTELSARAAASLRARQEEDAAQALAAALELAADDDDLAERLAAIPPLPAEEARARVDGTAVVVSWRRSPSQAGEIGYRVTRRAGRGGAASETPVTETTGTEVTDTAVPAGSEIRYSVVAVRSGQGRSAATATNTVVITPEVTDLAITATASVVTASWRTPPGAARVDVLRGEDGPPRGVGDGVRIDASASGFRDTGVRANTRYYYRIQAVYLTPEGRARPSAGILRGVTPTFHPTPVRDLSISAANAGAGFLATWTPPAHGEVILRHGGHPPPWSPGTPISGSDLRGFGTELPRTDGLGPDRRARMEFTLPLGRHYLLAVTVSGEQAVAGNHVEMTSTEPVRELRAERFDTVVRLSWLWPGNAAKALVSWSAEEDTEESVGERAGGELRCDRRRYEAEGGFEATMGERTVTVTVRAIVSTPQGEVPSPPVSATVPGASVLDYHVSPVGLLRRDRRVEVTARRACDLPELVVVHAPGAVQPYSREQGEVLARIPARRLEAGERVSVRVTPPGGTGPAWLVCFVANDGDERKVRLRQPSVRELRLR